MKKLFKQKKGTAGLTILLSVVSMLFIIGIIVMTYQLTGAKLRATNTAFDRTASATVTNESQYANGSIGYFDVDQSTLNSVQCSFVEIYNSSVKIPASNYSTSNCRVTIVGTTFVNKTWKATYSYTYLTPNTAGQVINETMQSLKGTTDYFPIYMTIAGIVVIVLLIVIIFQALRGAGILGGGSGGA